MFDDLQYMAKNKNFPFLGFVMFTILTAMN